MQSFFIHPDVQVFGEVDSPSRTNPILGTQTLDLSLECNFFVALKLPEPFIICDMVQTEEFTDLRATEDIDLLSLVEHRESVDAMETVESVYEKFRLHQREYVGVVKGDRLLGLVSRGQIGFLLGARYGFAMHARQPIGSHLLESYLCIGRGTPLVCVLEQALSRQGDLFYDDVALVDEDDHFIGIISVPTLVYWQSKLITEKTRLAENQQLALQENNRQLFRSLNELRQSQGRYKILFDNSAMGVALINSRGEMETCNRRLENLLGGLAEKNSGQFDNLAELVIPAQREAFLQLLRQHEETASASPPITGEFLMNLSGRGPRLLRFHTNWIRETGQICALLDDITEQRVLEHRLIQKEKSALLESLVGGVAHEINNKLAPIVGYAELLISQIGQIKEAAILTGYCATIRDSAMESAKIIRQLMHLSKPVAADLGACDLRDVIQEALTILRFRIRESGSEVILDLPEHAVLVLCDATQIKQVVINLVLNALDAMQKTEQKQLRLSLAGNGRQVTLAVADSGCGIKPEHLRRIFDPFFTTKGPDRGTGLGLSVCHAIIRQHNGEITVDSTVGVGSKVIITLPLATEKDRLLHSTAPKSSENVNNLRGLPGRHDDSVRKRVLIADDEEFITGMVQEALRLSLNCQVECVNHGQRAIDSLQQADYDLIISDVRMPEVDGFALFEWIKHNRPELVAHFLFITGDAGSPDLNEKIESLEVPVLRKPFDMEALVRECRRLVKTGLSRHVATEFAGHL